MRDLTTQAKREYHLGELRFPPCASIRRQCRRVRLGPLRRDGRSLPSHPAAAAAGFPRAKNARANRKNSRQLAGKRTRSAAAYTVSASVPPVRTTARSAAPRLSRTLAAG